MSPCSPSGFSASPGDTSYGRQWAHRQTGAEQAWDRFTGAGPGPKPRSERRYKAVRRTAAQKGQGGHRYGPFRTGGGSGGGVAATAQLAPGYLRPNGVPYSAQATMKEFRKNLTIGYSPTAYSIFGMKFKNTAY